MENTQTRNTPSYTVRSAYFVREDMDDSLSDFQDKKTSVGPKPLPKTKTKPKRTKRVKGQKDIRSVLKSKKNELESYSKDFDKVCKQAGLDVDSEQLQLAIALSKSLQQPVETEESQPTTSQERVGKIRTTLLEYGFKVPEIKINKPNKRKGKPKKQYKLLLTSKTEKETIIANNYSHILLKSIIEKNNFPQITDYSNIHLYYLATNADYCYLKNLDNLYVDGLIEKSRNSGNLLRDWSEIPGRPVSPIKSEPNTMNFSEIECSQDELDVILSGTLISCKNILKSKEKINTNIDLTNSEKLTIDSNSVINLTIEADNNGVINIENNENKEVTNNDIKVNIDHNTNPCRSMSPDIFDDDTLIDDKSLVENKTFEQSVEERNNVPQESVETNNIVDVIECIHTNLSKLNDVTKRKSNDFMEITECILNKEDVSIPVSQKDIKGIDNKTDKSTLSQNISLKLSQNITKRKSDDFMEMTKCVTAVSQNIEDKIDLTQSPQDHVSNDILCTEKSRKPKYNDTSLSDDVILENSPKPSTSKNREINLSNLSNNDSQDIQTDKVSYVSLDLTQSSNTSDELPFISLKTKVDDNNLDNHEVIECLNEEVFDLTQNYTVIEEVKKFKERPPGASFFEEFVHDHSDSIEEILENNKESNSVEREILKIDLNENQNGDSDSEYSIDTQLRKTNVKETIHDKIDLTQNFIDVPIYDNDIDLTQSSDENNSSQNNASMNFVNTDKNIQRCSSLGKKDDISIDYDEFNEANTSDLNKSNNLSKYISLIEANENSDDDLAIKNDIEINRSQSSEFHVSDKELDYSLNKSRADNFNIGGISIIDNISKVINRNSVTNGDIIIESKEQNTPIKRKRVTEINTPDRSTNEIVIQTPNKSELVIRTDNVTPMPCYELMSTPELHNELDNYGIKPFKRKRAIQLLTHIYNQLHPVIEYSNEDVTPSKRRKLNEDCSKRPSPRKILNSPRKTNENRPQSQNISPASNKENIEIPNEIVYEFTNDPIIEEVNCDPSDWVFQKREKAKVHSCRVPLHIAFHNYVTSRRGLHEAILCYEPIHIDVVHKDLVGYGHKYDSKDLLKFMDKKCITVKTTDNDGRNQKK